MSALADDSGASLIPLFRAVDLSEAADIIEFEGFRCRPGYGYEDGKWFAASFEDAVRWGRAFQRFTRPRPFQVVTMSVPDEIAQTIEYHHFWDAIGPAYYVHRSRLSALNRVGIITISEAVFNPEDI